MTRWEAREVIRRRDPQLAARLDRFDPLPPALAPCRCDDDEKIEVRTWERQEPIRLLCSGACRQHQRQAG